jgi:Rieske Fe-S protein
MHVLSRVLAAVVQQSWRDPDAMRRLPPAGRRPHSPVPRTGASRRLSRREALGLLIAGGSVTLGAGAGGIGLLGIVRKLASRAAQPITARPGAANAIIGATIGSTAQARNTATDFVHPGTGHACLLARLPDGAFAAYEKACTHKGVFVAYDPATRRLVCPAHGAIFDPAHHGAVVQGPATQALPQVPVQIDATGAIRAD